MTTTLLPVPKARFFDASGLPLAGGKVYTYVAGTTTPKTSYTDSTGGTPNANPVILDANGQADIWLDGNYKIVLKNSAGTQQWSVDNVKGGTDLSSFTATATSGTASATLAARFNRTLYAVDFSGVDPTGVADSYAGLQAAIDTGRDICLPPGLYKTSQPLTVSTTGQRLYGENGQNSTLLLSASGSPIDLLRIAGAYSEVENILFRPSNATDVCLRLYAGFVHVADNRFLAHTAHSGTAIMLTETNPVTGGTVAGAYSHVIERNQIGYSGYDFQYGIDSLAPTNGINACKFQNNGIIGDNCIRLTHGGGNDYTGNQLSSATGTTGSIGLDLATTVQHEKIYGNYFQNFQYGVLLRKLINDYLACTSKLNEWDNCTNQVYSLGTTFYSHDNEVSLQEYRNGWRWTYSDDGATLILLNPSGTAVAEFGSSSSVTGLFTPVITFDTPGDLSVSYSTQSGTYYRMGNQITVNINLVTSAFTHTTSSGNLRITGLPFTIANTNAPYGNLYWQGITKANYTDMALLGVSNATYMNVFASGSAQTAAAIGSGDMPTAGSVILRGSLTFWI